MTKHLPECILSEPCSEGEPHGYCGFSAPLHCIHCGQWCDCERIERVEQRVLSLNPVAAGVLIAQRARERALDAAREAVDALGHEVDCINPHEDGLPCVHDQAKSAIDALRRESNDSHHAPR